MKHIVSLIVTLSVVLLALTSTPTAQVPNQMQYQGYLTDDGGTPLDTTVDMEFVIYDDSTGSGIIWSETHLDVTVEAGLFEVILGSVSGVTSSVVDDSVRWLGITVGGDSEIYPRTKLVTVPYAFRVSTVDGATGGTISGDVIIQSDLDLDGDLRATGKATIGLGHVNTGSNAFVAGSNNSAVSPSATVGGGSSNRADGFGSTVGGGQIDTASANYATVSGGHGNTAGGSYSAVGGGDYNRARGDYSTIPGGAGNVAAGQYSFAAGHKAQTSHNGTFIWADKTDTVFASTSEDQFLIRASGGVGIGTTDPEGALDVSSTTGAFIVPRMTTAQRDALTAVNGMIIYNTTTNQFNFRENGAWVTK